MKEGSIDYERRGREDKDTEVRKGALVKSTLG